MSKDKTQTTLSNPPVKRATKNQENLLNKIERFIADNNHSPSFREIREMMGVNSHQSVVDMLDRMKKKGLITKEKMKARSIIVLRSYNPMAFMYINYLPIDGCDSTT